MSNPSALRRSLGTQAQSVLALSGTSYLLLPRAVLVSQTLFYSSYLLSRETQPQLIATTRGGTSVRVPCRVLIYAHVQCHAATGAAAPT